MRRANGSIMRELEEGALPNFKAHDGLQVCHALIKTAVPLMRATGCPEITYADTIQHFGVPRPHTCTAQLTCCYQVKHSQQVLLNSPLLALWLAALWKRALVDH